MHLCQEPAAGRKEYVFYRVVEMNPQNFKVPHVPGQRQLTQLDLVVETKSFRELKGGKSGGGSKVHSCILKDATSRVFLIDAEPMRYESGGTKGPLVFAPGGLTYEELASSFVHVHPEPDLLWAFKAGEPHLRLLSVQAYADNQHIILGLKSGNLRVQDVCNNEFLLTLISAGCVYVDGEFYSLSEKGESIITRAFHCKTIVHGARTRDGVQCDDMTRYELLQQLEQDEWRGQLVNSRERRRLALDNPYTNEPEVRKILYVRPNQLPFREYLLALLLCKNGQQLSDKSIAHLRPKYYYTALLNNEDPASAAPRRRHGRIAQERVAAMDLLVVQPPPPRPKRRQRRARVLLAVEGDEVEDDIDGEDQWMEQGDSGFLDTEVAEPADVEHGASASDQDTNSNTSDSNNNSSSSNTNSTAGVVSDAGSSRSSSSDSSSNSGSSSSSDANHASLAHSSCPHPVLHTKANAEAHTEAIAPVQPATGRRQRHGELWGPVPFVPVFRRLPDGSQFRTGYQCLCRHPEHARASRANPCQKTRAFNVSGGEDKCKRLLKLWILEGFKASSWEEHQAMWQGCVDRLKADTLPAMAELDAQCPTSWALHDLRVAVEEPLLQPVASSSACASSASASASTVAVPTLTSASSVQPTERIERKRRKMT
eukprot:6492230-Amphidinium_carterae.4